MQEMTTLEAQTRFGQLIDAAQQLGPILADQRDQIL